MNKSEQTLKNITVLLENEDVEKNLTDETNNRKDLKNFHKGAVRDYGGLNHIDINNSLRGKPHKYTDQYHKGESDTVTDLKHITKKKTNHDFHAYRGIDHATPDNFKEGQIIHDKGFTSTSLDKHQTHLYTHDGKLGTTFKVHVKKGTKGAYVAPIARYPHEKEFILHPGTHFKVGTKNEDGTINLHVHKQDK